MNKHDRILGLDIGKRRVGVAITDELLITAQPLSPLETTGINDLLRQLDPIMQKYNIQAIVLGKPCRLDGRDDHLSSFVEKIKTELEERFKVKTYLYDERFTSKIAQQSIYQSGYKLKRYKKALDSIAASLILSDFLKLYAKKDTD